MKGEAALLTADYRSLINAILTEVPEAGRCLVDCRHCGIAFFTDPRNAGRRDLGCPFGCAEAHRKRESTRRSVAYYREKEGREKKRRLNQRRHRITPPGTAAANNGTASANNDAAAVDKKTAAHAAQSENQTIKVRPWNRPILEYVRLTASLIEDRRVCLREAEDLLAQTVRQHSMARLREIDHLVAKLHQNPP